MFKRPDTVRKRQTQDENNTTLRGIDEKNETVIKNASKNK